MPSDPHGPDRAGSSGTLPWQLHTGTVMGAGHRRDGRPNQDAAGHREAQRPDGSAVLAVAVADGHGDPRHCRSERGSAIAAEVAVAAAIDWSAAVTGTAAEIQRSTEQVLIPDIIARWQAAVAADLAAEPFTTSERGILMGLALAPVLAYGSTLLMGVLTTGFAVFAQIGDGDIVAAAPDGSALRPVPGDDSLDGLHTTSLCQPDPAASFRTGVVDLASSPLAAVLAATDGFGNAQADDPWHPGVAADLARFGREHDSGWFAAQVPDWAAQCASSDGSGDDTTIALLISPAAARQPDAERQQPSPAATTIPVTAATQPDPQPAGGPPADPGPAASPPPPADPQTTPQPPPPDAPGGSLPPAHPRSRQLARLCVAAVIVIAAGVLITLVVRGRTPHPASPPARPSPSQQHPSPTGMPSPLPSPTPATPSPSPSPASPSPAPSRSH